MKRRIFFTIAAMIFLLGVWGTLTRKDPIEKNIGYVYLFDGKNETSLKGYKVSVNRNDKKTDYEYPEISDVNETIYKINASSENESNMQLSYSKDYYGDVIYTVYDSEFNAISENQTSLNISGGSEKLYYVSVSIFWGTKKENINMIYYFSIQT